MARSSEPRNINPPEGASRDLSPQRGRNVRAAEEAHVAHGGASLFDEELDGAVGRVIADAQQPEGVSIKLSDRYEALKGIADAAAKRSRSIGAQSDAGWEKLEQQYGDPQKVLRGLHGNAENTEVRNDDHLGGSASGRELVKLDGRYEKLVAGKALEKAGLHPSRVEALKNGIQRSVEAELGVGVGQAHRDRVLRRVWDGSERKAKSIKRIQKTRANYRKRHGLPEEPEN